MGNGLRTQARRVLLQQVAPTYHHASGSRKQEILEEFVSATGYARKYALWLLHHVEEVFAPPTALRRRYGPEVEEALVLAWKTLNRICTKRLIPFLPDILEALEEVGHIQLSKEHRSLLLSMSAATADRFLQAHRYTHPHGLSTTKVGPLLKQQIPIRTFGKSGRGQTGLSGGRSGRPLWRAIAGWLPLYDYADRCRHRVDGMPPFTQPWARSRAGCLPARSDAVPISHSGIGHR